MNRTGRLARASAEIREEGKQSLKCKEVQGVHKGLAGNMFCLARFVERLN